MQTSNLQLGQYFCNIHLCCHCIKHIARKNMQIRVIVALLMANGLIIVNLCNPKNNFMNCLKIFYNSVSICKMTPEQWKPMPNATRTSLQLCGPSNWHQFCFTPHWFPAVRDFCCHSVGVQFSI